MTPGGLFCLLTASVGYLGTVYCLFRLDTKSEKSGDWKWTVGMLAGIVLMILGVLLWAVPGFFNS